MTPLSRVCRLCGSPELIGRIDFGLQPICNRYLRSGEETEELFPRILSQCPRCSLLQMGASIPAAALRSRFSWIRYAEPEGHLDDLVDNVIAHTGLTPEHVIYGLSYKDKNTLDRFRKRGFVRTVLIDPAVDLGDPSPGADMETIQSLLTEERASLIASKYGHGHLVIARHLLEHVHDLHPFSRAIRALLTAGGFFLPEEPDISLALELRDYSTIWEQRTVFFTPATLERSLAMLGFQWIKALNYEYPLENALVAISRVESSPSGSILCDDAELRRGELYGQDYPIWCDRLRRYLSGFTEKGRAVAMFGAGHMACNFINLHLVQDCFELAVDDHPDKRGLFMPGSRLPILGSSALVERNIGHCLLSVRPEIEQAIISANAAYVDNGGTFASILPRGPSSIHAQMNRQP